MSDLEAHLRTHVDVLAELIGERNTAHAIGLDAARHYIRRELSVMGHAVTEQSFAVPDRGAINLEVVLRGTKPSLPSLIIGAHYNSVTGTPGADDNASAVAMLLEIARVFAGRRHRRPVRLVFFDCEEPPYFNLGTMGSQHHAAELKRSGEAVFGMICLESLGYFPATSECHSMTPWPLKWINRLLGQRYVVIVSDVKSIAFGWRFLWRFASSGFFPFVPAALPVKWVPDIALSDHRGYWEQSFAALMVTDTAHLRNPNYHQRTDRLATLDLPRMAKLCRQLCRTLTRLAG